MSLIKVNKNENPYDVIGNYIEKHVSVIDNIIAVISIDGTIHNELLLVEITYNNNFVWLNDWWEGEENVELIDFFFVSEACKKYSNNDFISRQSAIDMIDDLYVGKMPFTVTYDSINSAFKALIRMLPSAQPKIIHCEDCKYGMLDPSFPHQWFCKYKGDEWNNSYYFCGHAERREVTT